MLILTLPDAASGQPPATQADDGPLASAVGGFIAISVPDVEASAAWYAEKLGLKRVMTVPRSGKIAGVVALEGAGIIVEIIQHDEARPSAAAAPELAHGIAKAGVIVSDFDQAIARLRARGIAFVSGPYPPRPTIRANAMFKDNAGNVLQILGPYAPR